MYGGPPLLSQRGRPSISIFSLESLLFREFVLSPLVVPKIVCLLFTTHNFDHCANSHSLHRPQGAVVFLALPIRQNCITKPLHNALFYVLYFRYYIFQLFPPEVFYELLRYRQQSYNLWVCFLWELKRSRGYNIKIRRTLQFCSRGYGR